MNLFNKIFSSKKSEIYINEKEKYWIVENYKWLLSVYGLPSAYQVEFTKNFFPKTFENSEVSVENLIADLAKLFGLNHHIIKFSVHTDLRDSDNIPLETEGDFSETEIQAKNGEYEIIISGNLLKHDQRLLHTLILDFVKIKFMENKIEKQAAIDENLFLYLVANYFGFGIILSKSLIDIGYSSNGVWQTNWRYSADMSLNLMAFSLALYAHITEKQKPKWIVDLPSEIKRYFNEFWEYLIENPIDFFTDIELNEEKLLLKSEQAYDENNFDEAIAILEKILKEKKDDFEIEILYNNLGYYEIRRNNLEKAIFHFKKALEYDEKFAFANDNLGFVLVLNGNVDEGKRYIDIAMSLDENDIGYSYRNLALYYQAKGDSILAEKHYQLAYENTQIPVDLLDFYFGKFLIENGDKNKGIKFLKISKKKGEPEAEKYLSSINQ